MAELDVQFGTIANMLNLASVLWTKMLIISNA